MVSRHAMTRNKSRRDLNDPHDCGIPEQILSRPEFQSIYGPWPSDAVIHNPMLLNDIFDLDRSDLCDSERLQAARRLTDTIFANPIYPQRWEIIGHLFISELARRATINCRASWRVELQEQTITALFGAVSIVRSYPSSRWVTRLRRALNKELSLELLGMDWRRKSIVSLDAAIEREDPELDRITGHHVGVGYFAAQPPPDPAECATLQIMHALANLDAPEQELVLNLNDVAGYSSDEFAHRLKCSSGAVRVRLHRARRKMPTNRP